MALRLTRLRSLAKATVVGERGNVLSYAQPAPKLIVERVRRKKAKSFQKGDNKTGNILIDNAGKIGLGVFCSAVFYFYRGWKSGKAEEETADRIMDQSTVSPSEINELRASNPYFDLVQYETFSTEAWKTFPKGRVTKEEFHQLIQEKLQHLIKEGDRIPHQAMLNSKEFPIKGWYVLDRVIGRHQRDCKDNTFRLTDLLTTLSLCMDSNDALSDVLRGLYTVSLLDQRSSDMTLDMATFPTLVESFIGSNLIPAKQQTKCSNKYPMFDFNQATPKDIAKRAVLGSVIDFDERYYSNKSYMTRLKEALGVSDEVFVDGCSRLRNVDVPDRFGSKPPAKFVEWIQSLVIGGDESVVGKVEEEATRLYEDNQEKMSGQIEFEDFYQLMISRHLCAMNSCIKLKKKKKRKTAAEGEEEFDRESISLNYRRVQLRAQEDKRQALMLLAKEHDGSNTSNEIFIPSNKFQGRKDGYYYGHCLPYGLGYHRDFYGNRIRSAVEQQRSNTSH
jgi:hypothetical protein